MASYSKFFMILALGLVASCGKDGKAPSLGCTQCRIFVTTSTYNGNLGGVAGADAKCMADANNPDTSVEWKAQITDFTYRSFEDPGWVFEANTPYYRPDGTLIGTTNGLAQLATLTNAISTTAANVWTGGEPPHCNLWNGGTNAHNGFYGSANSTTQSGYVGMQTCDQVAHLYCVEQ